MDIFLTVAVVSLGLVAFVWLTSFLVSVAMLSAASRTLKKRAEEETDALASLLPGDDCGICGEMGCREYAESVLQGRAQPDRCPRLEKEAAASFSEKAAAYTAQTELPRSLRERKRFLRRAASDWSEEPDEQKWHS